MKKLIIFIVLITFSVYLNVFQLRQNINLKEKLEILQQDYSVFSVEENFDKLQCCECSNN